MPWTVSSPPPSYKNLSAADLKVAVAVANSVLEKTDDEGRAVASGAAAVDKSKTAGDRSDSMTTIDEAVSRAVRNDALIRGQADAPMSTAVKNELPDSAFLYIKPGGEKDDTGRTVPRSLRMLPVCGPNGKPSRSHIVNALGRLGQPKTDMPESAREEARRKAERMLEALDG